MYAIRVTEDRRMVWEQREAAALQAGQLRIRIRASALNRADVMQRAGMYPPPPGYSDIPGLECAGDVVECGEGVAESWQGAQVCALLAAGGYATEVVVDVRQVLPIPKGLSYEQAAALPEVFATAWLNLFRLADLQGGEKVLLKAGASGVGTAAIQLCRAFGNPVWVQVGSDDKLQRCMALGAAGGINRHRQGLAELVEAGPFDVILDPVAGSSLAETLPLLAMDGRMIVIGLMGGRMAELDVGRLLVKRQRIFGSTLRSLPVASKAAVVEDLRARVWPLLERGDIHPVVDRVMPIEAIAEAHEYMESNQSFGKIVITLP